MEDFALQESFAAIRHELRDALAGAERAIDRVRDEQNRNAAERASLEDSRQALREQFEEANRAQAIEMDVGGYKTKGGLFACCMAPGKNEPHTVTLPESDAFGTQTSIRSNVTETFKGETTPLSTGSGARLFLGDVCHARLSLIGMVGAGCVLSVLFTCRSPERADECTAKFVPFTASVGSSGPRLGLAGLGIWSTISCPRFT
eukprot:CAMPEP_0197893780 /NCGR_PEP_ID=MMETSP1439-20131203/33338_1 /TAXON_ID=66791 /ORGANISM="Gonyaulax spinifera, Strain CCMP409" /LENGTH=202 /DNA_ID=CAMNT_0043514071 /DNA_START=39 /DNA_END=644 /DNA_ORIENTATION=+